MGRRIENKRVISNDRVRKERKQKNKIIIAVEGKNKTEKLYFNNLNSYHDTKIFLNSFVFNTLNSSFVNSIFKLTFVEKSFDFIFMFS